MCAGRFRTADAPGGLIVRFRNLRRVRRRKPQRADGLEKQEAAIREQMLVP
jgi:hypothetical protein